MTTPKRSEIELKARELFIEDQFRKGCSELPVINPTYAELIEGGYFAVAQSCLMRDVYRHQTENEYIDFPQDFNVDIKEIFESNALILGSRHTGKSDIAMLICDKAKKEGAVVVVFDPSLDWLTRSSIHRFMKVERYTNLEPSESSMIYDISLLSPMQQTEVVERFSKRLFEAQAKATDRKQYLVIFEEAHTYFLQGCMRSKKLQNTVRLLSVGRNVDVACVLISQFAAMLDKFAVKHSTSQAWFGYTKEPNDVGYLKQFLGENVEQVTKLEDGQFVYLTREKASKINIKPYRNDTPKIEVTKSIVEPSRLLTPQQTQLEIEQDTIVGYGILGLAFLGVLWIVTSILR